MINKVILIGNVGRDPEVRALDGGVKVASVNLATTEKIYNPVTKENRDHTEWHRLTFWRGLAGVVEKYVKKGDSIYVEGRLRTDSWGKDGEKRYSTSIVVDEMKMLGGRGDSQNETQPNVPSDLPF